MIIHRNCILVPANPLNYFNLLVKSSLQLQIPQFLSPNPSTTHMQAQQVIRNYQIKYTHNEPARSLKKSTFSQHLIKEPTKNLIKKFMRKLMQKAYVYKENYLNSFTKAILTEKYLEREQDENFKISKPGYMLWDALISFLILILLLLVPFQVGFSIEKEIISTNILNLFMASEILILFFKLLKSKKQILISILHLGSYIIIQFNTSNTILLLCLITQFISGLQKLQLRYEKWKVHSSYDLDLYFILGKLILIIHFFACIWHFLGTNTWITALGLEESDNFTRYCYSFQWTEAQLLGSGQGQLNTNVELIYSSILMLLSCWIFYYMMDFLLHQNNTNQPLQIMNQFLAQNNIRTGTRYQIRKHLQFNQTNSVNHQINQISNIISALPPCLRQELHVQINTKIIQNCKLFTRFSPQTKHKLAEFIQYHNYELNEFVSFEDINLYIIVTGQIQAIEYGKPIKTLKSGDFFGEYTFFSGIPGKSIYKTMEQTTLYTIALDKFKQIVSQNKEDHERFMFIKDSLLNGNLRILNLYCQACDSASHLISDCNLINYKPNILKLVKQVTQGQQERQPFNRNSRNTKLNINPDTLRQDQSSDDQDFSPLSRDQSSNNSNENFYSNRKMDTENSDVFIIRSPIALNTPQFLPKHDQQQNKFSFYQKEQISPDPISSQSNEGGTSQGKTKNLTSIKSTKKESQLQISIPNTEDQFIRQTKLSQLSMPSRFRSTKRFSSKISSIKQVSQNQLPAYMGLVDLSNQLQENSSNDSEEFETMYNYAIYFPQWNISSVLLRLNVKLAEDLYFSKRSSISSSQRMIFLIKEQIEQQ